MKTKLLFTISFLLFVSAHSISAIQPKDKNKSLSEKSSKRVENQLYRSCSSKLFLAKKRNKTLDNAIEGENKVLSDWGYILEKDVDFKEGTVNGIDITPNNGLVLNGVDEVYKCNGYTMQRFSNEGLEFISKQANNDAIDLVHGSGLGSTKNERFIGIHGLKEGQILVFNITCSDTTKFVVNTIACNSNTGWEDTPSDPLIVTPISDGIHRIQELAEASSSDNLRYFKVINDEAPLFIKINGKSPNNYISGMQIWTKKNNEGENTEEPVASQTIKIGTLGIATYCSKYDLDFSNTEVKAYIVSAFKPNKAEVTLTRVDDIPAGTGIIVMGNAGTYEIPTTQSETVVSNLLKGVVETTVLSKEDGAYTNYVMADGSNGLGFYAVKNGSTLSANKAYLPLLTSLLSNLKSAEIKGIGFKIENGNNSVTAIERIDHQTYSNKKSTYFTLSGQKIITPSKGIYIQNGKKVFIKK